MNEQEFILEVMKKHELPDFNRLSPDYEYCTIELQTRDMKDIFVMTITKKKSAWSTDGMTQEEKNALKEKVKKRMENKTPHEMIDELYSMLKEVDEGKI